MISIIHCFYFQTFWLLFFCWVILLNKMSCLKMHSDKFRSIIRRPTHAMWHLIGPSIKKLAFVLFCQFCHSINLVQKSLNLNAQRCSIRCIRLRVIIFWVERCHMNMCVSFFLRNELQQLSYVWYVQVHGTEVKNFEYQVLTVQ